MEVNMKIVAILSQKGGTGKTTIATNLCVAAEREGHTTALIDLDPQASATRWGDYRKAKTPAIIATPVSRLGHWLETAKENGATLVVLDTAPNSGPDALDVARTASIVLIPCKPSMVDLDAIENTVKISEIAKVPARVVLNCVDARSDLGNQARQVIRQYDVACAPCELGQRVGFVHAFNHGTGVQEFEPRGKSSHEITALYEYLNKEMEV